MAIRKTGAGAVAPTKDGLPKGFLGLTVIDRVFTLATDIVWACCIAVVAYTVYLCVKELAGHQTVASFLLGYFSETKGGASAKPWIGTTVVAAGWGVVERWLRRRTVGSMSQRLKDLERLWDAGRSSSGLTETGQVPKKRGAKG